MTLTNSLQPPKMLLHINIYIQAGVYQENTTSCEDTFPSSLSSSCMTKPSQIKLLWSQYGHLSGTDLHSVKQHLSSKEANRLQQGQLLSCLFHYGPKHSSCRVCRFFPPLGHKGGSHTSTFSLRHCQLAHSRPGKNLSPKSQPLPLGTDMIKDKYLPKKVLLGPLGISAHTG